MASVRTDKAFNRQLARQVRPVTKVTAYEVALRADALLAVHKGTGPSRIVVEAGVTDFYVILDDPASLSIEFGRGAYTRRDGKRVGASEGLHVLSRAVHG